MSEEPIPRRIKKVNELIKDIENILILLALWLMMFEGIYWINAYKEIQQIIDTPYDCMCQYERIEDMKCIVSTVCCVNCADFKKCLMACPPSEKWVISGRLCGYAHKGGEK